jgi:hypothetical protein
MFAAPENQRQGLGAALSYLLFFKTLQEGIQSAVVEIDRGNKGQFTVSKAHRRSGHNLLESSWP